MPTRYLVWGGVALLLFVVGFVYIWTESDALKTTAYLRASANMTQSEVELFSKYSLEETSPSALLHTNEIMTWEAENIAGFSGALYAKSSIWNGTEAPVGPRVFAPDGLPVYVTIPAAPDDAEQQAIRELLR